MRKHFAFICGTVAAAGVWLLAPMLGGDMTQVLMVGTGRFQWVALHGYDLASAAAGLAVWIVALHFRKRPRRIAGIRHGVDEPLPWPPRFA